MISKLRLVNFLSYKDVTIEFNEFNVILGSNASGKSNLIKALTTIRNLILGGFTSLDDFDSFMEGIFSKNAPENESLIFEITIENPINFVGNNSEKICFNKHYYYLELKYSEGVVKETYFALLKGQIQPYKILERDRNQTRFSNGFDLNNSLNSNLDQNSIDNLRYQPIAGKGFSPLLLMLNQAFVNYFLSYNLLSQHIISPSVSRNQKFLQTTGNNLAGVIQYYKEHIPGVIDSINEILRRNIPNFLEVDTRTLNINKNYFFVIKESDDKYYSLNELSEGTDLFVGLVTAMVTTQFLDVPKGFKGILMIEEPEKNLHPQLMEEIISIAKSLTDKFQVLFTTHSTDIVAQLEPSDLILIDKTVNGTRIKKVKETKELKQFLNEFSLDQLWLSNDLDGGTING